jgi:enoyl-CoA hydratase
MFAREDQQGIAVLRLAHGKVSALDTELCETLAREITDIASSPARALVVTGTGSVFSAGVDLFQVINGGAEYLGRFLPAMESLFRTLLTCPKPAVAAVNGHAIAGGCIIAAACDHRVMAEGTGRIGVPELQVGVPFPALPFEIVRARVSPAALRHLVFSGRTVLPADALTLDLVDELAPPDVLMTRALHAADQHARIPDITFRLTKRTFTAAVLRRVEAAAPLNSEVLAAWAHPAVQARVREYLERTVGKK